MKQISPDGVRKSSGRCVFRVPCFRFCKSILSGMKKLQEIDKIAILQLFSEEKLQICNLTACQEKSDTSLSTIAVKFRRKWYQCFWAAS